MAKNIAPTQEAFMNKARNIMAKYPDAYPTLEDAVSAMIDRGYTIQGYDANGTTKLISGANKEKPKTTEYKDEDEFINDIKTKYPDITQEEALKVVEDESKKVTIGGKNGYDVLKDGLDADRESILLGIEGLEDLDNKQLIHALGDKYMEYYLQKRDILKNQTNVNSKSRKAQMDKERIDELNKKMGDIENSKTFQELVESIARGEYEKDVGGNNVVEKNIIGAIAAKVGTSKTNVKDYSNSWAKSATDNAKDDFRKASEKFSSFDGGKIKSTANNILNNQIVKTENKTSNAKGKKLPMTSDKSYVNNILRPSKKTDNKKDDGKKTDTKKRTEEEVNKTINKLENKPKKPATKEEIDYINDLR